MNAVYLAGPGWDEAALIQRGRSASAAGGGLLQSLIGEVAGSSNSVNATTTTVSHSLQRKNPDSVSTDARAFWQASQTFHRIHIP